MPPRKTQSVTFVCSRYPQLGLPLLGVSFDQGRLEVTDPATAKAIRAMAAHYGISEEGGGSEPAERADESDRPAESEPDAVQSRTPRRAHRR